MKYMGSKRTMLENELGALLAEEIPKHNRFVDIFSGSAAVAWHVASHFEIETHAYDLQLYARVLAASIIERTDCFDASVCWGKWKHRAQRKLGGMKPPEYRAISVKEVMSARKWSSDCKGSLVRAYGGHYYSPKQACWIEALRATLPEEYSERSACLAALIIACSKCAAAPGHTAQPFQPTSTAITYLAKSWERDLLNDVRIALENLSTDHAQVMGSASVGEANAVARKLAPNDLVFVDPPYSAVQYSRFYHVLEAVAKGEAGDVFGVGRYPPREDRPTSAYSSISQSLVAFQDLLENLAGSQATVILTFPDHQCSNGISGDLVRDIAVKNFRMVESAVSSVFSTMGGSTIGLARRSARRHASELLLLLRPK